MTNQEIADKFTLTAQLLELQGENPFKIKAYTSGAFVLEKYPVEVSPLILSGKSYEIQGLGSGTMARLKELVETGQMSILNDLLQKTPKGILNMFKIKGLGPKKIAIIWHQMGISTLGDLLYACHENRLAEVKGFGVKTQESIQKSIEFYQQSQGYVHYAVAVAQAEKFKKLLTQSRTVSNIAYTGSLRRKYPVIQALELVVIGEVEAVLRAVQVHDNRAIYDETHILTRTDTGLTVKIWVCTSDTFESTLAYTTAWGEHLETLLPYIEPGKTEFQIYEQAGMEWIPPELRENNNELILAKERKLPQLIEMENIKGVIHTHTRWSDGRHSTAEMAEETRKLGYLYLCISDHSQSAFYANGLSYGRLQEQWREIDSLNAQYPSFKIYKSIESDILSDGSLDYSDDILAQFDFVIASIHSNLNMDKTKATDRLLKAIANPYTRILGHPTGRLLLMREGYPVDMKTIIQACAAYQVAIEINANPYRLDLDWTWISYAIEQNVWLSINPDAHSKEGIQDIHWGVECARKGGLTTQHCLNALSLTEFEAWVKHKIKAPKC